MVSIFTKLTFPPTPPASVATCTGAGGGDCVTRAVFAPLGTTPHGDACPPPHDLAVLAPVTCGAEWCKVLQCGVKYCIVVYGCVKKCIVV